VTNLQKHFEKHQLKAPTKTEKKEKKHKVPLVKKNKKNTIITLNNQLMRMLIHFLVASTPKRISGFR
jgi:hypothetical protein